MFSSRDYNPLFKAIRLGKLAQAKKALEAGLDLSVQFKFAERAPTTALNFALEHNQSEIASALLDRRAAVDARDKSGSAPLHCVRDVALAKRLIDLGAQVNVGDREGNTPLHRAAQAPDFAIAELLIENGAKVAAKNRAKKTTLELTRESDIRQLLQKHGARMGNTGRRLKYKRSVVQLDQIEDSSEFLGADTRGNIWFGSGNTFFFFDGKTLTQLTLNESFSVENFADDGKGAAYFSTGDGLLRFARGEFRLFCVDDSEIIDNNVTGLYSDRRGKVYFLCYEDSKDEDRVISVFDGRAFRTLKPGVDFPAGLEVGLVAFDPKGGLILGTTRGVVLKNGRRWQTISKLGGRGSTVYSVLADRTGLWVGTEHGLVRWAGRSKIRLEKAEVVNCICAPSDALWLGTYAGLIRIRGKERITFLPGKTALPSEIVKTVVLDKTGTVWAHTDLGMVRIGADGVLRRVGKPE